MKAPQRPGPRKNRESGSEFPGSWREVHKHRPEGNRLPADEDRSLIRRAGRFVRYTSVWPLGAIYRATGPAAVLRLRSYTDRLPRGPIYYLADVLIFDTSGQGGGGLWFWGAEPFAYARALVSQRSATLPESTRALPDVRERFLSESPKPLSSHRRAGGVCASPDQLDPERFIVGDSAVQFHPAAVRRHGHRSPRSRRRQANTVSQRQTNVARGITPGAERSTAKLSLRCFKPESYKFSSAERRKMGVLRSGGASVMKSWFWRVAVSRGTCRW